MHYAYLTFVLLQTYLQCVSHSLVHTAAMEDAGVPSAAPWHSS